jgi:hypothetical protein
LAVAEDDDYFEHFQIIAFDPKEELAERASHPRHGDLIPFRLEIHSAGAEENFFVGSLNERGQERENTENQTRNQCNFFHDRPPLRKSTPKLKVHHSTFHPAVVLYSPA